MQNDVSEAIRTGDVTSLTRLICEDATLVQSRIDGERTLLHVATDWPGHFPNVRETISVLVAHGADVNAKFQGRHSEAPLHWAASSGDMEALNALLENGADLEQPGAVIGGGTPLADAVAFGLWPAARRLVESGARSTMWQAAALGLLDRVEDQLAGHPPPSSDAITNAFWSACHGGQLLTGELLLKHGADLNCVGYDGLSPLDAAARSGNDELVTWLRNRGAISGKAQVRLAEK